LVVVGVAVEAFASGTPIGTFGALKAVGANAYVIASERTRRRSSGRAAG
jgi:hypothetical protein